MDGVVKTGFSIVTAFVVLAILAVILSKKSHTLGLVQNISSAIAQSIGAATGG